MELQQIIMLITIAVYLIMMVVVGVICAKKTDNVGDFYLGGRKLGPFVTAMSAEASDMSGWLLMGLPGVAYATGIADAAWTGIGLAIGTYLNWLIVSKRIRKYSHVCNSITIPDFFSNRFRDNKKDTYSYFCAYNNSVLHTLYGFGLLSLRKTVQQPFRSRLSHCYDNKCSRNHRIYYHRWIFSRKYY